MAVFCGSIEACPLYVAAPSLCSVLSSVGQSLEYLAGSDPASFASTAASVPALLAKALDELQALTTAVRASHSVALLQTAAL